MKTYTMTMDQLSRISKRLFLAMGCTEEEAGYATDVLVETNRRGVDTHGIARLSLYHMFLNANGMVNKHAKLKIVRDEYPYLMVDADHGLGIIMAPQAMELALQRAKERGMCVMGIRHSGHFGAAGYYTSKCVEQGFIALVSSNSGPTMVPYGGKRKVLGNSPWSMAFPGGNRHPDPVMFDMACSEVSRGKCETAQREGREVPQGWGVDEDGNPSTDPAKILFGGSLLPFGGIKGYCIALLVEVLSSMLAFASAPEPEGGPRRENTGHFILLLDPNRFGDIGEYRESIDAYFDKVKNTPTAPGISEIIVPGELEARYIKERTQNGIELDEAVVASLVDVAHKTGQLPEDQGVEELLAW